MITICQIITFGFLGWSLRPDVTLVRTSSDAACYAEISARSARGQPLRNIDLSNKYSVERLEQYCGKEGKDCPMVR